MKWRSILIWWLLPGRDLLTTILKILFETALVTILLVYIQAFQLGYATWGSYLAGATIGVIYGVGLMTLYVVEHVTRNKGVQHDTSTGSDKKGAGPSAS